MPLIKFKCPKHGQFQKIVAGGAQKEQCPRCKKWSPAETAHPNATVRVSVEKGERAEVMRDEELEVRMAAAAEEARRVTQQHKEQRLEAEKNLPDEVREQKAKDIEYRQQVEDVIKSEPQENLDEAGLKVWRATSEHEEKMKEKRGVEAVEQEPDPSDR